MRLWIGIAEDWKEGMGVLWQAFFFVLLSWGSFMFSCWVFFPYHSTSMPAHRELKTQTLQIVLTGLNYYCLTYFPHSTASNYHPRGSSNREWTVYPSVIYSCSCFFAHIPISAISVNMVCIFASLLLHLRMSNRQTSFPLPQLPEDGNFHQKCK